MSVKERAVKDEEGFVLIYSADDIPEFKSEREEHEFWNTHVFSEEFIDQAVARGDEVPAPPTRERKQSRSTSLRLDEDTLKRLRYLARKKGKGYQTLLKEFVVERLYEEEKREGVLG